MKRSHAQASKDGANEIVEAYLSQCAVFRKVGRINFRKQERRKKDRRRSIVFVETDRRYGFERRIMTDRRMKRHSYPSERKPRRAKTAGPAPRPAKADSGASLNRVLSLFTKKH